MHWTWPATRFVFFVVALAVLTGRPVTAGPQEPPAAGVIEAHVADEGDEATSDEARPAGRPIRAPLRDPWSVGVRALWSSFGGSGGEWHPSTGGNLVPIRGSCSPGGPCSTSGLRRDLGRPIGHVTGNHQPVQGIAFDAGRLISAGVEIGAGLDLTTHPAVGMRSASSLGATVGGPVELSHAEHAAQVFSRDQALQIDLAGRLTYRFGGDDARAGTGPVGSPYVGFGAGVSRYFPGFSQYGTPGLDVERQRFGGVFDRALFETWTPNVQFYGGFTVRFPRTASMLDVDFRYVRAALHGLDLGGFRLGIGIRYPF